jgi:hypothetical protein
VGTVIYVGNYFLSGPGKHHSMTSILVFVEKFAVIQMGLLLLGLWHFSLAHFAILSLFCMPNVLTII